VQRITTPEGLRRIGPAVDKVVDQLRSWLRLIGKVGGLTFSVMKAIAPEGQKVVDKLAAGADKLRKWVDSAEGTRQIQNDFRKLTSLAGDVAKAIAKAGLGCLRFSADAAPAIQAAAGHLGRMAGLVGRAFGPVFRELIALVVRFFDELKPLTPFIENILLPVLVGVFNGVLAALRPLVTAVGVFADVLGFLGRVAGPLKPIFEDLGGVLGFLFAGPILVRAAGLLRKVGWGFQLLAPAVGAAGRALGWFGGVARRLATGAFARLGPMATTAAGNLISSLAGGLRGGVGRVRTAASSVRTAVTNGVRNFLSTGSAAASNLVTGLVTRLRGGGGRLRRASSTAAGHVKSALTNMKAFGGRAASALVEGLIFALAASAGRLRTAGGAAKNRIKEGLKARRTGQESGRGFGQSLGDGLRSAGGFIKDNAGLILHAILFIFTPTKFFTVGKLLIQGLGRGIRAMAGFAIRAVARVIGGAIRFAKRLLRIGSPSKVFASFGQDVGRGFIQGVEGMRSQINRSLERTLGGGVEAMQAQLTAGLSGGLSVSPRALAGVASGGGPQTVNNWGGINIPAPLAGGQPDPVHTAALLDQELRRRGGLG